MIARLLLLFWLACALPAPVQAAPPEVAVRRVDVDDMHVFDVTASAAVLASPAAVWKILTDYDRMPEFVPDLKSSRVLSRVGNEVIVEQFGVARFLFIRRDIHLVIRISEVPATVIEIALVDGDMKVYRCRWELTPIPETGGTRVVYTGKLAPKFYVPGMIGANLVRADVQRMLVAVVERLERPG